MSRTTTLLWGVLLMIWAMAGECLGGPPEGLIAYWTFDDATGSVAVDASGNGNDGAIQGDPQWVTGMIGGALDFDGNGDFVDCGNDAIFDVTEALTLAVWVNLRSVPGDWRAVIAKGDDAWRLATNSATQNLDFAWTGSSRNYMNVASTTALPLNEWHHVCCVYSTEDGGRIYIDGIDEAFVADTQGITTGTYPVYIGDNSQATGRFWDGLIDDLQLYARALSPVEIQGAMKGLLSPGLATDPRPADESIDVPRDVVLGWTAGELAATHDVYFGTSFDDVNNASRANPIGVLLSQSQAGTSYAPAAMLDFETTYYWRVDEVNAAPDHTIYKGEIWSFTVEPFAYPVTEIITTSSGLSDEEAGPQNTINGSGLNANDQHSTMPADMWLAAPGTDPLYLQYEFDRVYKLHRMWVWNYNVQFELMLGFGLKNVTIEYSENGVDWTVLGDVEFAQATAKSTYTPNTTVDFGGIPARYVRLNVNSGWGMMDQFGLSEVRFLYIPAQAREPQPADGATDVEVGTTFTWRSGREAASHEVYLSTDPSVMTLTETVETASFEPALEFGGTYYWQIVEINAADETPAWASDVWTFSTQEYAWIDGFESYNDDLEAGTTIFDTWLDGWVNENGSTVGYFDAPFAERSIVRSGTQSMPLQYDNTMSPFYSEAERTFDVALDWAGYGADRLVLYVRGNAPAFLLAPDDTIVMNAVGTDIWDVADEFRYAYKSLSGNGSMTVRVDSLVRSNEWAKAGVMIRETLEPGSKHAYVSMTPTASHGVSFQRRPETGQASANTDVADIEIPHWVRLTRTGSVFTAQQSSDGVNWVDIATTTGVDIPMAANVYIGLAATSHDAGIITGAQFSGVSTTGDVTGDWQVAEIGTEQPEGNSPASLYVTLEDDNGASVMITNPDAAITARPSWQEWAIPYSDLASVNLSRVQTMVIGIGRRTNPSAGGTGTVYVDDIGFGRPK